MDLTHEQWQRIKQYIAKPKAEPGKSGRLQQDLRAVLKGTLWILRTGAPWAELPERYPPKSTCHRRFQEWTESRVFAKILTALTKDLKEPGGIDLSECFIDGTFAPAKKGAMVWARPNGAKEPRSWVSLPRIPFSLISNDLCTIAGSREAMVNDAGVRLGRPI